MMRNNLSRRDFFGLIGVGAVTLLEERIKTFRLLKTSISVFDIVGPLHALYGEYALANMIGPDVRTVENGIQLVFSSEELGKEGIYIIDIDIINSDDLNSTEVSVRSSGSIAGFHFNPPKRIINDEKAQDPKFSPDGNQLVYASSSETGNLQLYRRGLNEDDLTTRLTQEHNNWLPTWSPEGIAYSSNRNGNLQIHLIDDEGTHQGALTEEGHNWAPGWSTNGRFAFISDRRGRKEVYVMDVDGSNQQPVSFINTDEYDWNPSDIFPAWSPDGSQIVFSSDRGGLYDLYVINADGTGVKRITNASALRNNELNQWDVSLLNQHPVWDPITEMIWYESVQHRGPLENGLNWTTICAIKPDGTGLIRIVNSYPMRYEPQYQYA